MADMDSAAKRYSTINHTCPWRSPVLIGDGSDFATTGEREALLYLYSGIAADEPAAPPESAPNDLSAVLSATVVLTWSDTVSDNTAYSIQRRDGGGGSFTEIDTVGADIETYEDVGPFTAGVAYAYRLEITGGALDGSFSNEDYVGSSYTETPVLLDEQDETFRRFAWGT